MISKLTLAIALISSTAALAQPNDSAAAMAGAPLSLATNASYRAAATPYEIAGPVRMRVRSSDAGVRAAPALTLAHRASDNAQSE